MVPSSIGHPPHSSASPVKLRLRVGPHALSGGKKRTSREQGVNNFLCQSGIVYTQKKTYQLEKIGLFLPFFPPKLQSWILLLSVRLPKKVPSAHRKNIRPKTSDLQPPPPLPNTKNTRFSNECLAHTMAKVTDRS